jgi:hypothetical protein
MSAAEILVFGLRLVNCRFRNSEKVKLRRFKAHFGAKPECAVQMWDAMRTTNIPEARLEANAHIKHLLISLHFLKCYPTEEVLASKFGLDEKTVRNWVWKYVKKLALLKTEKIKLRPHVALYPLLYVTVDGTDCPIEEPQPWSSTWFSHKVRASSPLF